MADPLDWITEETDEVRHNSLKELWLSEHKPAYLTTGGSTYLVIRKPHGEVAFKPIEDRSLYESTSFR